MKRILLLNSTNMKSSFSVAYSTTNTQKATTITISPFISQIFRIIQIPDNATNIIVKIYTVDVQVKKTLIKQENFTSALNVCYEIYQVVDKIEAKTVACQKFQGAYSISGINKTKTIIRAKIIYTLNGVAKSYISNSIHRDELFGFLIPTNAKKIKIQVDKCISVINDTWANIYTELIFGSNIPTEKCYMIIKPLLRNIKCISINCSKFQ